MTDDERRLWAVLRRKQLAGYRFRRQHPMGPYVADFFCASAKLIVELDGGQHSEDDQMQRDEMRTRWLASRGYRVLRIWNNELKQRPNDIVDMIVDALQHPPCNLSSVASARIEGAVAGESPYPPRSSKTARKPVTSPVVPSNPNSRLGRKRSPIRQGRVVMEMTGRIVGIDVSKDRLDVAILPEGSTLVAGRDGKGLAELCEQLRALEPMLVAIEATGGFESVAAAALASAGLPVVVVNPHGYRRPAVALEINDFGATPGVVGMRIAQAFGAVGAGAGATS
jgi:very-short-patch-repair endonuclease